MEYKITLNKIKKMISRTYFANDGDISERKYGAIFKERFPNCETFWRYFVVPFTKRIEQNIKDQNERIRPRESISEDIQDIASIHYSMFLNLVYSYNHLRNFRLSSFEDFYIHLVSACDLAEEFLLKIYLLVLECRGQKSEVLQKLNKENFLKLAGTWYDNNYLKVYEDYLKKGKTVPIRIPSRKNVLDEYLKDLDDWREYKRYTQKIREYINVIVHYVQIGKIIIGNGIALVPKKEKIQQYKKWSYVFAALQDKQKLKNDFIDMKKQMVSDIENLGNILDKIWNIPIKDFQKLFFDDKNEILLKKYNIVLEE